MKTLYLECNMGAAGDMLLSALLELVDEPDFWIEKMNGLGLDGVHVVKKTAVKCGIKGTKVDIHIHGLLEESTDVGIHEQNHSHDHNHGHGHDHHHHSDHHDHSHSDMKNITDIINGLPVPQAVKDNAVSIYHLIAEAEADAHGRPVSEVHFHEVGAMDAVADIVGVCMLIDALGPEQIIISPVHVGSGFVRCAHGVLPVPAPAAAYILRGVPTYGGTIRGELCTPTGAAILKHFADKFQQMPEMITEKIGYGMGNKDFETANCVRAFLGEAQSQKETTNSEAAELHCNLDDMSGEAIGYALQILFENGALDVFTTPIQMKKNRPGTLLTCICETSKADFMAALMLKHTTTFGVRRTICSRYTLDRTFSVVSTEHGEFRIKTGTGYGVTKSKPEYEDLAAAAKANKMGLDQIYESIIKEQKGGFPPFNDSKGGFPPCWP